jgi:hypothetical protein
MERLESLIKDRQEWITISEKNNFDFDMILSGLYNDPSHYIKRILRLFLTLPVCGFYALFYWVF